MLKDAGKYVDYIDHATWQRLVGALLNFDGAEILSRQSKEIFTGVGAGTRIYRVTGTAAAGGPRPVDWTMVVKVLTLDPLSFQSISTDQTSWNYWKREWHIYQSAWQQQLPGPLVAPRCLATGEILAETDNELAWIAMEDLGATEHGPWPHSHFRKAARHVGIFNGDYLGGRPLPADPWLSHDEVRGRTELAAPLIEVLPVAGTHPVASRIFTPDMIDDLTDLWNLREKLYAALDALPQTLCHNDFFHRNLFVRVGDPHGQTVAIDWSECGPAPVGQELSALVGATQVFMGCPQERWNALERDCLDGYAEGLREAGWIGTDEILLGYLLSSVLRYGIGALPPLLDLTLSTHNQDLVAHVFGCSYDEFVAHIAALLQFQQRRMHQARALVGI